MSTYKLSLIQGHWFSLGKEPSLFHQIDSGI